MLPLKRKRVEKDDSMAMHSEAGSSSENDWEDHDVELEKDNEDSEMEFIQDGIVKRNIKDGTELLKKTSKVKGKGKAKGEVGGGSFQSMGTCIKAGYLIY
jgi:ATP-dependent RNA helicase DDX54/DBP10